MRLIDADEINVKRWFAFPDNRKTMTEALAAAPTVDAVPVIRCKDCCYLAKDGKSLFCTYHDNINVTEEFFCATGEVEHADARKPV